MVSNMQNHKDASGRFQYLLFDLDGTLTDPKAGITGCVQYALHKLGIEEPDKDKLELMGHTSTEMLRHYQDVNYEDLRRITDAL